MKSAPIPMALMASLGTLVTESPCRRCQHYRPGYEADLCITRRDCPLHIPRQKIYAYVSEVNRAHLMVHPPGGKRRVKRQQRPAGRQEGRNACLFEGCTRRTSQDVCFSHRRTVERRIATGLTGPALYERGRSRWDKAVNR